MINNTYYTTSMISSSPTSYLSMNNYSNEPYPTAGYCSCCCSFSLNSTKLMLPIPLNPTLVLPPSQSNLIHWAPPSRLLLGLGGGGGCGIHGPGRDLGMCYFRESCCGREDMMWGWSYNKKGVGVGVGVGGRRGRIGRSGYRSNALGDAEAMLSLLAEDTTEACLEGRENRRSVGKEGRVVEENIVVCEVFDDEVAKSGLSRDKGEGRERSGEVERLSMGQDLRSRRKESSSSYYSLSDFESDGEDEVKRDGYLGDSSASHGEDSRKVGVVIKEDSRKDSKRYSDKSKQQLQGRTVLDHSKVASLTEWDCRKKSEKKLATELSVETKSEENSLLQRSHSSKASSSKKHFNSHERDSTSGVNSHWQSWSHIKTNDQESVAIVGKTDQQKKSESETNNSRDDDWYAESTLRTRRRLESRMKNVEERTTSLVSGHSAEWTRENSGVETVKGNEAIKLSQTSLSSSQAHSSISQHRLYDEQAFLASRLKSVEEEISKQKQIDKRIPSGTLISQTPVQQVSQVEDESDIHISVVGPSYQFIEGSKYGQPSTGIVRNDADTFGSVVRMEEISNEFVGEFVEKMRHDASTSSDTGMEKASSQIGSINEEKNPLRKQGSRRSSRGSGSKGPSDEMWDVKDHFPHAPSEKGATSEDSVSKRTGKSLWNVVAGVFRWGSQSEPQKSPAKIGSGRTWFSENDNDEVNGQSLRTEQSNMSGQSTSLDKTGMKCVEEDAPSSSSSVVLAVPLSEGVCVGASTDTNVIRQTPQCTPSLESPMPSAIQSKRSDRLGEIEEAVQCKDVISLSEASEVEFKQSKLKRSEQFQKERFKAWEDAYRRENEQRKVDEIFMREALVEARKASDLWEVPVGAVLVQNGKIIARGYNLVEELRDSTAHAEMICVREASNVLKTWRLSETTLYVTLEPCPMCAGAVLQARVGTVVWGAPNKLLGADGSWIRLFPEGPKGEQRPEASDKPAAPIHPFHPKMKVRRGVLDAECAGIMQDFFKLRRKKEKAEEEAHSSCLPVPHRPRFFHKMHDAFHLLFRL